MEKKKGNLKKGAVLFLIFILFFFTSISFADVGSFDRYDSGGSDWGDSSSSDWGSSSSDWDWGSGGSSWGSYTGGSFSLGDIGFLILIIVVVVVIVKNNKKRGKGTEKQDFIPRNSNRQDNQETIFYDSNIVNQIKEIDPAFNEEKFLAFAKDLYVRMQNAWTEREWEPMRSYESVELFEQHRMQLQGYIDTNRINVVDRIAVNYARLFEFKQEGGKDILAINLKATKKDYIIDATTKEVLEGNKLEDRVTVYRMVFERKTGVLTKEASEELNTTNCPNCGAPTHITSSGKCEYCGSMITTDHHDWILTRLEPVRQGY